MTNSAGNNLGKLTTSPSQDGEIRKLSLRECRSILGRSELTDEEVLNIRDVFYFFSASLVNEYIDYKNREKISGMIHPCQEKEEN